MAERRQAAPGSLAEQGSLGRRGSPALAAVGISVAPVCGVRDHTRLLAEALREQGSECSLHWLELEETSLAAKRARIGAWTRGLRGELARAGAQAIVLQYSVFAFSHRGLPLFVRPTLAALRDSGRPIVSVLHEYAYPWRRNGVRGLVWATSQRAVLRSLMHASAGVIATTEWRERWLTSRAWLPARPVRVAPVFSNLPTPSANGRPQHEPPLLGMFGYAYERRVVEIVLAALAALERRGTPLQLLLIGAPGADSELARMWLDAARSGGLARPPEFSGTLRPQDLSDRLASCELLLSAEPTGPSSRKGTLAASLASGRPVVAFDGRRTWRELIDAEAALAVPVDASALADALAGLAHDAERRERIGQRARAFAAQTMTPAYTARVLGELVEELTRGRS